MISVAMRTYNEDQLLPKALASAVRLTDDIVIVDNLSTDRTREVAKEFGARVITSWDRSNNSYGRNLAAENAKNDWIVVLDADEVIEQPEELREYMLNQALSPSIITVSITHPRSGFSFRVPRIYLRTFYHYRFRGHEGLYSKKDYSLPTSNSPYSFLHFQPPGRWPGKLDLAEAKLFLDVAENPGHARPLYYLARQYYYQGVQTKEKLYYRKAVETFSKYFSCSKGRCDDADAFWYKGTCLEELGKSFDAIVSFASAVATAPRRREFWVSFAKMLRKHGYAQEACDIIETIKTFQEPSNTYYHAQWYKEESLNKLIKEFQSDNS